MKLLSVSLTPWKEKGSKYSRNFAWHIFIKYSLKRKDVQKVITKKYIYF